MVWGVLPPEKCRLFANRRQSRIRHQSWLRSASAAPIEQLESRVFLSSVAYAFANATIEGGGFVDGIFFSPTQQNVIYARTDIGGLYKTTNGGTSWKQLLDFVGSSTSTSGNGTQSQLIGVLSFAIDPENANNIYADVGEYSGTNGAVFYSTNAGATWSQTNLGFWVGGNSNGRATGERIAVDPYDSSIVLLGSNANGLWESTNAGHSFSQVTSFSTSASITFVEFKPYGGTAGAPTQNMIVGVNSVAGLSPQVAGNPPTNLYQTTNGGATWSEIGGTTTGLGKNVLPTTITSLTTSGSTATAVTASATGFAAGDRVTIAGATPTAYDGTFTITAVPNSTSFSFNIASGTAAATGAITATANYSLIPNHAVWASNGYIYLTCSDGLAPSGTQDIGGVFQYNTSTGAWANISPEIPGAGTNVAFGYLGLALDPENDTTIAVTSVNRYSATDALWRTTTASSSSPTWVALYDTASAQNNGFGGYDTTRNTSNAPWIAGFGDGIGNWPATVAIDPFNSAHLLYGDGQGLWATNDATSASQLTAAKSWYFPDYGIEFTAVSDLIAPASGAPLVSAMGDINGFVHTTLTSSPAAGAIGNGSGPLDFDQANSNYIVDLGGGTHGGEYTANDGATWAAFAAEASSGGGDVAVSATPLPGQPTLLWAPSGALPYYSTNNGAAWTASSLPAGALTGGRVISDRVDSGVFYYTTESSGNNQFSIYESTNAGVSFTLVDQLATGSARLVANPFVAGDLWLTDHNGLAHSTNFGSSFTTGIASVQNGYQLALGAPAPGSAAAAIYLWGEVGGIVGLFRSDDFGKTFTRINDTADQWGGLVQTLAADPNVFGRVYMGINGRGIIIGDPVGSLPTGWSDADVNTPGNPGFATDSAVLSSGAVVNQWIVDGGGAGIGGTADQFNFASDAATGNSSIVAQITSLDNAGTGTPQAGVMVRAGSSSSGDPFVAIVQTTADQLRFEYRTASGASVSSVSLSNVPIGSEYVSLIRSADNFSAFYSVDGVNWKQLGPTIAISAMPATADVGLAVTANYNPQLTSATFSGVQIGAPPIVATAAAVYIRLDPDGQHVDIWDNATAAGSPAQSVPWVDIGSLTYTGPAGGDQVVVDFSNGDPLAAGGISLTGGAGQNTLEFIGNPASTSDIIAIKGGSFAIPANTPGAGTMNYKLGTISIAAGAELALAQSDSQADQTVFNVNNLADAGTLDITNNTLLANESNVLISQITTWVQNAGTGPSIMSSLVTGPNAIASRAVGYGDWSEDPLTVPAGDVEVKYVPVGDTNLDGYVDIADVGRAINNLGQSPGYYGGDILNQGLVNITDIAAIMNDLGATLNASGDSAGVAAAAVQSSAGAVTPAALGHAAASPPSAGGLVGSLFSDTRIAVDWLESAGSALGKIEQ